MTPSQLTEYAGGFVEYCRDAGELTDMLIDMGFCLPHPDAPPDKRTAARAAAEFERQTGVHTESLINVHWALVGGRVFVADEAKPSRADRFVWGPGAVQIK